MKSKRITGKMTEENKMFVCGKIVNKAGVKGITIHPSIIRNFKDNSIISIYDLDDNLLITGVVHHKKNESVKHCILIGSNKKFNYLLGKEVKIYFNSERKDKFCILKIAYNAIRYHRVTIPYQLRHFFTFENNYQLWCIEGKRHETTKIKKNWTFNIHPDGIYNFTNREVIIIFNNEKRELQHTIE